MAVNDQFTVNAWKEKLGGADKALVHFIADDEGKVSWLGASEEESSADAGNSSQGQAAWTSTPLASSATAGRSDTPPLWRMVWLRTSSSRSPRLISPCRVRRLS